MWWNSMHAGPRAPVVGLVGGENDGFPRRAKSLGNLFVARNESLACIEDEHEDIGGLERLQPMLDDQRVQWVGRRAEQSAGVHERECPVLPGRGR